MSRELEVSANGSSLRNEFDLALGEFLVDLPADLHGLVKSDVQRAEEAVRQRMDGRADPVSVKLSWDEGELDLAIKIG